VFFTCGIILGYYISYIFVARYLTASCWFSFVRFMAYSISSIKFVMFLSGGVPILFLFPFLIGVSPFSANSI
jgi:hypothetical protein